MFITLRLFMRDLRAIFENKPNELVGELGGWDTKNGAIFRVVFQSVISLLILFFGFSIIRSPEVALEVKELAAGFIGTVVGYWLR
jgi:hypothetical protein